MRQTTKPNAAVKPVAKTAPAKKVTRSTRARSSTMAKAAFKLSAMSRPGSGHRLFAHTYAAFMVLGMLAKGYPAVAREKVIEYIGERAVKYHVKSTESLVEDGDNLRLTPNGVERFAERLESGKARKEEVDAYVRVFSTGKPDAAIGVRETHILPV